jgi:hypothetical protein
MKPPSTTSLPFLRLLSAAGPMNNAELAVDIAGAVLGIQAVILEGLIKAGVIDGKEWRALFQATLDGLSPTERQQAYGYCLSQIIAHLDTISRGEKRPFKFH